MIALCVLSQSNITNRKITLIRMYSNTRLCNKMSIRLRQIQRQVISDIQRQVIMDVV